MGTTPVKGSSSSSDATIEHLSAAALWRGRQFLGDASMAEGEVVRQLTIAQRQLQAGGFYAQAIDADFASGSQSALAQFLRRFPLPAGTPSTPGAKLAWLQYVAEGRFRTPDTVVRLTLPAAAPSSDPNAPTPSRVVRATTTANPTTALHEMPLFLRDANGSDSRTLLGRLTYTTGAALDDAYDHTTGHTHSIDQRFIDTHLQLVAEAERRLPALPLWSGPLVSPDQSEVAAIVARGYAQAARWYHTMALSFPADATRYDQIAQQYAQRAVDVVSTYGRAPADATVVEPSGGIGSRYMRGGERRFSGALARLPDDIFARCTFDGAALRTRGTSQDAIISSVVGTLNTTNGPARREPTAAQVRAALYPQRAGTAEIRRVRDQLVRLHVALHHMEHDLENRVALALFSKPYAQLSEAQQRTVLDDSRATRGEVLNHIDALERLEQKLSMGDALTTEERATLTASLREATALADHLERRRPDYGYANVMRANAAA